MGEKCGRQIIIGREESFGRKTSSARKNFAPIAIIHIDFISVNWFDSGKIVFESKHVERIKIKLRYKILKIRTLPRRTVGNSALSMLEFHI